MKIKHKLKHLIHSKRNKHPEQIGVRILATSRNVKLFDREIHYLSFGIRNIIIFSSREYIDSRKQVLDTAFSYESDGKIVLFKSIKQESISFLSEDLKKDWMFHKVKTGEKDGYGSDEMLSAPRIYLEMMSRKTGVPYSSIL